MQVWSSAAAAPLLLLLVATINLVTSQPAATSNQQEPEPENAPEPYSFGYSAESVGGMSAHQESGDGRGHVQGFYMLMGDDGRERRVDYVADENGYRASVSTNEVGTRSESAGDAQYQARLPSSGQLEQAKVTAEEYKYLEDTHAAARARHSAVSNGRQQQQQQKSYNNLTSGSSDDEWRARSAALRQTTANQNLSPPAGSTVAGATNNFELAANAPQPQQQSWRGALPAGRTVMQRQLEQQFMQQANQLTEQDYPRGNYQNFQRSQQQSTGRQVVDFSQFNQQQNNVIDEVIDRKSVV